MRGPSEAPPGEPRKPSGQPASAGGVAVELRDVRHSFGALEVLAGVDLTAPGGSVVGLVGPSGCGKSTLLELLAGITEPSAGAIAVGDASDPAARLARCALMPQRDLLLPWLSALDNAALAPRNRGETRARSRELAAELFERFGLGGFERARPAALSGGMRQRVAFLRTLMAAKPVLLLDEPFAALDAIARGRMQEWLAGALAIEPRTTVLVTHDVEEALYLCDRVLVLSPRPARALAELAAPNPRGEPRRSIVSAASFAAVREEALSVLEGAAP